MSLAYIALGSNVGDRAAHLLAARDALAALSDTTVARCAPVYETEPVGPGVQERYLNSVIELRTHLDPVILMKRLLAIESQEGRVRRQQWGPRTLDLDLLLYDDQIIAGDILIVPHPRMHERAFVLKPLCDINQKLLHPVLVRSVRELLDALHAPELQQYDLPVWSVRPT